ncbi:MAG: hypothetical protein Q4G08_01440 [Capnocytophaga sp.]|nr:hypothetical protein [Capnocytophaga sp.]
MKNKEYVIVKADFEIIDPSNGSKTVYRSKFNSIVKGDDAEAIQQAMIELRQRIDVKSEQIASQPHALTALWDKLRSFSRVSRQSYYRLLNT